MSKYKFENDIEDNDEDRYKTLEEIYQELGELVLSLSRTERQRRRRRDNNNNNNNRSSAATATTATTAGIGGQKKQQPFFKVSEDDIFLN